MTASLRSALDHHLALDHAHTAARAGDLDLAARLLDGLDAAGAATPAALDLRARVHAQRGDFAAADRYWARVLLLVPDDAAAREGREAIARIQAGRRSRPLVTAGAATVAAAAVLGAALVGGVTWVASSEPAPVALAPENRAEDVWRLEQQLAAVQGARQEEADRLARDLDAIAAAFTVPGVVVQRRDADVRLVFEAGLFRSDAELADGSWPLLTEVGRRVAGVRAATTVVGHVVAVPGGVTSGGSTVALARAQVAARALGEGGGLPLTAFTLVSADQADGPFPDDARNRTVTLVLRPAG
ncbi:hypothetical protein [Saccharothrix sp. HUAS TT1]|uniref:hypothetical protein n=1 Tax=unclassified Saccharothrix TaxID=2593673 RepID=UPI00345C05EF